MSEASEAVVVPAEAAEAVLVLLGAVDDDARAGAQHRHVLVQ